MLTNNTKDLTTTNSGIDLSFFQRQIFYILLFFMPWFVVPLPWDPTEQIKVIFFIVLASTLVLIEIVKWIWGGKVTILKSVFDKAFLLIYFSFVLSTVFALDKWVAVWGFDGRMGIGLISISVLILFFFLSRSFLKSKEHIYKAIEVLIYGLSVLVILSLLSFFNIEILNWVPYLKYFFVKGLPLTFYSDSILLVSSVLIFLSISSLIAYIKEKKYQRIPLPFLSLILGFVSIPLFSMSGGILIPVLVFVGLLFASLLLFLKLEKNLKFLPITISLFILVSMIFTLGLQNDSFKESVVGENFNPVIPVTLAADVSWTISSSVVVEDFFRGLVGMGNESFGIAYSLFRPAVDSVVSLGNTSFAFGANELFTSLASRGILGVVVWVFLGVVIIKTVIVDVASSINKDTLPVILLEINAFVIFFASLFMSFSFLSYFLLFTSVLLIVVARGIVYRQSEEFLLKFWAVNTGSTPKNVNNTISGINWFLTCLIVVLVFVGLFSLGGKVVASAYILRAEAYSIEETEKYESQGDISLDEREEFFNRTISYYYKALKYDPINPIANRRASRTAVEIMNVLGEVYRNSSEEEKPSVLSEITRWKNVAIDLSREAINTSSYTYTNWNTRATVYVGFLGIGLSDYSEDALASLQSCINLNPLDYESYFRAGQIYMIKNDFEKALAAFEKSISINGQHVPSIVLSARIMNEMGDTQNAIIYLREARRIMEVNKLEGDEMYKTVIEALDELGGNTQQQESDTQEGEVEEETLEEFAPMDISIAE